ncbi:hypothetical protein WJX74_006077 [Apatococcus lobatus]|uniref:Uncharacterized protein n=1 Tax=Apatococcus lobatus TaxID=904363 RepID=A0AAW1S3S2_9CHLO
MLTSRSQDEYVQPPIWPEQFHSVMLQNRSGSLALVDLWYDWPAQRNLNLIQNQQAGTLWDIEWGNRTSYYFDREANTCKTITMPVGLLTPNWLSEAEYVGQQTVDNHLCNVWKKEAFIIYWADVKTGKPVKWIFEWTGATFEILTWSEGEVLEDEQWQAPAACFSSNAAELSGALLDDPGVSTSPLPKFGMNVAAA